MKLKTISSQLMLVTTAWMFFACSKELSDKQQVVIPPNQTIADSIPKTDSTVPYPETGSLTCQYSPDYGDSILYPQPGADYIAAPLNNIGIAGKYFGWPDGLSLNSSTGAIDVTKSISGVRYAVGFVKNGTTDTCLSPLIIGGASYEDSVYVLAQSDTTSRAYFNANPYGPDICDQSGPDDGNKCKFDVYGNAKLQGITIDKKTGYINLKQSMQHLMFGPLPFDGEIVYSTFYYQVDDNTNNAVQQMQVEFIFFNNKSEVPADLLNAVGDKLTNILNNILVAKTGSPKPPLIIITRN